MNAIDGGNDLPREAVDSDEASDISVGGLGVRLAALEWPNRSQELSAVGKVVELRRRERGLSTEKLAIHAHVSEDALMDLERGLRMPNSRDVIRLVCVILDIPADKLIEAAGLSGLPNQALTSAAMRLASQAKIPESLSAPEHAALSEFMGTLLGK
jgi:transcriptional regulator with XRE-family HTH domain